MKPVTALTQIALCLGAMSSVASAWPEAASHPPPNLIARQNDEGPVPTGTMQGPKMTDLNTARPKDEKSDNKNEDNTDKNKKSKGTATRTTSPKSKTKEEFDPTAPPGGVKMVDPAITAGPQLYRVGDKVTWKWNYTSVLAEPTAVDLILSCPALTQTWTLTANMSFEPEATFVWNTEDQADDVSAPLLTENYQLIVKDSEDDISAVPSNGYLSVATALSFGLYTPRPYKPNKDWHCDTCNAATSLLNSQALGVVMTMCLATLLSFTWFVTGLQL